MNLTMPEWRASLNGRYAAWQLPYSAATDNQSQFRDVVSRMCMQSGQCVLAGAAHPDISY